MFRKNRSSNCSREQTGQTVRDTWGPASVATPPPPLPAALTHKPLIDEILRKVDQDQGDDVPQQALEGSEAVSGRLAGGHWPRGTRHHPYLEHGPPFLKGEVRAGVCRGTGREGQVRLAR